MAKTVKKQEETEALVIKPSMDFGPDHKNVMIEHVTDNVPELTSVGYAHIPGTKLFASYTIKTKGGTVISMVVDEPDARAIAEDAAKINFVNEMCRYDEEF